MRNNFLRQKKVIGVPELLKSAATAARHADYYIPPPTSAEDSPVKDYYIPPATLSEAEKERLEKEENSRVLNARMDPVYETLTYLFEKGGTAVATHITSVMETGEYSVLLDGDTDVTGKEFEVRIQGAGGLLIGPYAQVGNTITMFDVADKASYGMWVKVAAGAPAATTVKLTDTGGAGGPYTVPSTWIAPGAFVSSVELFKGSTDGSIFAGKVVFSDDDLAAYNTAKGTAIVKIKDAKITFILTGGFRTGENLVVVGDNTATPKTVAVTTHPTGFTAHSSTLKGSVAAVSTSCILFRTTPVRNSDSALDVGGAGRGPYVDVMTMGDNLFVAAGVRINNRWADTLTGAAGGTHKVPDLVFVGTTEYDRFILAHVTAVPPRDPSYLNVAICLENSATGIRHEYATLEATKQAVDKSLKDTTEDLAKLKIQANALTVQVGDLGNEVTALKIKKGTLKGDLASEKKMHADAVTKLMSDHQAVLNNLQSSTDIEIASLKDKVSAANARTSEKLDAVYQHFVDNLTTIKAGTDNTVTTRDFKDFIEAAKIDLSIRSTAAYLNFQVSNFTSAINKLALTPGAGKDAQVLKDTINNLSVTLAKVLRDANGKSTAFTDAKPLSLTAPAPATDVAPVSTDDVDDALVAAIKPPVSVVINTDGTIDFSQTIKFHVKLTYAGAYLKLDDPLILKSKAPVICEDGSDAVVGKPLALPGYTADMVQFAQNLLVGTPLTDGSGQYVRDVNENILHVGMEIASDDGTVIMSALDAVRSALVGEIILGADKKPIKDGNRGFLVYGAPIYKGEVLLKSPDGKGCYCGALINGAANSVATPASIKQGDSAPLQISYFGVPQITNALHKSDADFGIPPLLARGGFEERDLALLDSPDLGKHLSSFWSSEKPPSFALSAHEIHSAWNIFYMVNKDNGGTETLKEIIDTYADPGAQTDWYVPKTATCELLEAAAMDKTWKFTFHIHIYIGEKVFVYARDFNGGGDEYNVRVCRGYWQLIPVLDIPDGPDVIVIQDNVPGLNKLRKATVGDRTKWENDRINLQDLKPALSVLAPRAPHIHIRNAYDGKKDEILKVAANRRFFSYTRMETIQIPGLLPGFVRKVQQCREQREVEYVLMESGQATALCAHSDYEGQTIEGDRALMTEISTYESVGEVLGDVKNLDIDQFKARAEATGVKMRIFLRHFDGLFYIDTGPGKAVYTAHRYCVIYDSGRWRLTYEQQADMTNPTSVRIASLIKKRGYLPTGKGQIIRALDSAELLDETTTSAGTAMVASVDAVLINIVDTMYLTGGENTVKCGPEGGKIAKSLALASVKPPGQGEVQDLAWLIVAWNTFSGESNKTAFVQDSGVANWAYDKILTDNVVQVISAQFQVYDVKHIPGHAETDPIKEHKTPAPDYLYAQLSVPKLKRIPNYTNQLVSTYENVFDSHRANIDNYTDTSLLDGYTIAETVKEISEDHATVIAGWTETDSIADKYKINTAKKAYKFPTNLGDTIATAMFYTSWSNFADLAECKKHVADANYDWTLPFNIQNIADALSLDIKFVFARSHVYGELMCDWAKSTTNAVHAVWLGYSRNLNTICPIGDMKPVGPADDLIYAQVLYVPQDFDDYKTNKKLAVSTCISNYLSTLLLFEELVTFALLSKDAKYGEYATSHIFSRGKADSVDEIITDGITKQLKTDDLFGIITAIPAPRATSKVKSTYAGFKAEKTGQFDGELEYVGDLLNALNLPAYARDTLIGSNSIAQFKVNRAAPSETGDIQYSPTCMAVFIALMAFRQEGIMSDLYTVPDICEFLREAAGDSKALASRKTAKALAERLKSAGIGVRIIQRVGNQFGGNLYGDTSTNMLTLYYEEDEFMLTDEIFVGGKSSLPQLYVDATTKLALTPHDVAHGIGAAKKIPDDPVLCRHVLRLYVSKKFNEHHDKFDVDKFELLKSVKSKYIAYWVTPTLGQITPYIYQFRDYAVNAKEAKSAVADAQNIIATAEVISANAKATTFAPAGTANKEANAFSGLTVEGFTGTVKALIDKLISAPAEDVLEYLTVHSKARIEHVVTNDVAVNVKLAADYFNCEYTTLASADLTAELRKLDIGAEIFYPFFGQFLIKIKNISCKHRARYIKIGKSYHFIKQQVDYSRVVAASNLNSPNLDTAVSRAAVQISWAQYANEALLVPIAVLWTLSPATLVKMAAERAFASIVAAVNKLSPAEVAASVIYLIGDKKGKAFSGLFAGYTERSFSHKFTNKQLASEQYADYLAHYFNGAATAADNTRAYKKLMGISYSELDDLHAEGVKFDAIYRKIVAGGEVVKAATQFGAFIVETDPDKILNGMDVKPSWADDCNELTKLATDIVTSYKNWIAAKRADVDWLTHVDYDQVNKLYDPHISLALTAANHISKVFSDAHEKMKKAYEKDLFDKTMSKTVAEKYITRLEAWVTYLTTIDAALLACLPGLDITSAEIVGGLREILASANAFVKECKNVDNAIVDEIDSVVNLSNNGIGTVIEPLATHIGRPTVTNDDKYMAILGYESLVVNHVQKKYQFIARYAQLATDNGFYDGGDVANLIAAADVHVKKLKDNIAKAKAALKDTFDKYIKAAVKENRVKENDPTALVAGLSSTNFYQYLEWCLQMPRIDFVSNVMDKLEISATCSRITLDPPTTFNTHGSKIRKLLATLASVEALRNSLQTEKYDKTAQDVLDERMAKIPMFTDESFITEEINAIARAFEVELTLVFSFPAEDLCCTFNKLTPADPKARIIYVNGDFDLVLSFASAGQLFTSLGVKPSRSRRKFAKQWLADATTNSKILTIAGSRVLADISTMKQVKEMGIYSIGFDSIAEQLDTLAFAAIQRTLKSMQVPIKTAADSAQLYNSIAHIVPHDTVLCMTKLATKEAKNWAHFNRITGLATATGKYDEKAAEIALSDGYAKNLADLL